MFKRLDETRASLDNATCSIITAKHSIGTTKDTIEKIERFIFHNGCFKIAINRQFFYSKTLLKEREVKAAFFLS